MHGSVLATPSVVAFWHGEMLPIWKAFSSISGIAKQGVVSLSKDGEMLANLLKYWGFELIRGSSSRNSKETLQDAVDKAKTSIIFITPDGPRGPEKKFKNGAAVIAFRASVPIYLVRANVSHKKIFLKSWDKFILPYPFSKIDIHISEKYFLPEHLSREEISQQISEFENLINSMV